MSFRTEGLAKSLKLPLNHSEFMFPSMEICWEQARTLAMKVSRVLEDNLTPMPSWSDIPQQTN